MDWSLAAGVVVAFLGTAFGTYLNERVLRRRTREEERRSADIYRSLLNVEFNENHLRLHQAWHNVQHAIDLDRTPFVRAQAFIFENIPEFNETIWKSFVDRVGGSFSPNQTAALMIEYSDLRRIREWHGRLRSIYETDQINPSYQMQIFEQTIEREWPSLERLVISVLGRQSPLEDRSKPLARA